MSSIDLKIRLMEQINKIEDIEFLEAIKTILDSKTEELYTLSQEQKESIDTSRQQIINGNFLKNEDVFTELKEWIKKQ
jgi:hypothetical protein